MSDRFLAIHGKTIVVDEEGFLKNSATWTQHVARYFAQTTNTTLSKHHWEIIELARDFYNEFELSPTMRPFIKYIAKKAGAEKGNSLYLLSLFPGNSTKTISKIAGLPKPTNCL